MQALVSIVNTLPAMAARGRQDKRLPQQTQCRPSHPAAHALITLVCHAAIPLPHFAAFVGASNLGMALGPLLSLPLAYVPDWQVGAGAGPLCVLLAGRYSLQGLCHAGDGGHTQRLMGGS